MHIIPGFVIIIGVCTNMIPVSLHFFSFEMKVNESCACT
jgi:hypothetical protein